MSFENSCRPGRFAVGVAVTSAIVVIVAAAVFLAWWLCQPPVVSQAKLRDGTVLKIHAVERGPHVDFDPAAPTLRWLNKRGVRLQLPSTYAAQALPTSLLISSRHPLGVASSNVSVQFEDDHGCLSAPWGLYLNRDYRTIPVPYDLPGWSRWRMRLREEASSSALLGELGFGTSVSDLLPEPPKTPVALPATIAGKRVSHRIEKFRTFVSSQLSCSVVRIRARDREFQEQRWTEAMSWFTDRYGQVAPGPVSFTNTDPRFVTTQEDWLLPNLCFEEPYWTLSTIVAPEAWGPRPPDFDWGEVTVSLVNSPVPVKTPVIGRTSAGVKLEVSSLGAALSELQSAEHRFKLTQVRITSSTGEPGIRVVAISVNGETMPRRFRRLGFGPHYQHQFGRTYLRPNAIYSMLDLPTETNEKVLRIRLTGYRAEKLEVALKPPRPTMLK